jgi:hypothetical protein
VRIHLFSAGRLGEALAAGRVSAQEQALYLALSFCVWNIVFYLYLVPPPIAEGRLFWWLWAMEFFFVVLFNITGVLFCLRRCRVEPKKNFLVFFSCLYLPISLTTLAVAWGAFHLVTTVPLALARNGNLPIWFPELPWLSSALAYDVLRFFLYVGTIFTIFLRTGEHLERIANLQESAHGGAQATPASGRA